MPPLKFIVPVFEIPLVAVKLLAFDVKLPLTLILPWEIVELLVTVPVIFVVPAPFTALLNVPPFRFKVPAFAIPFEIFRLDAFAFKLPEFIFNLFWVTTLLKLTEPAPVRFVVPVPVIVPAKLIDLPVDASRFKMPVLSISFAEPFAVFPLKDTFLEFAVIVAVPLLLIAPPVWVAVLFLKSESAIFKLPLLYITPPLLAEFSENTEFAITTVPLLTMTPPFAEAWAPFQELVTLPSAFWEPTLEIFNVWPEFTVIPW